MAKAERGSQISPHFPWLALPLGSACQIQPFCSPPVSREKVQSLHAKSSITESGELYDFRDQYYEANDQIHLGLILQNTTATILHKKRTTKSQWHRAVSIYFTLGSVSYMIRLCSVCVRSGVSAKAVAATQGKLFALQEQKTRGARGQVHFKFMSASHLLTFHH